MKNKIIVLVSVMLLCLCTHRIYADSDYDYEIQHWNNFLGFMVPPVLTEDEYKNASENHEIIAEAYIMVGKARTEVKGFFKHYFPFLLDGDYYYLNLSFPDVLFDKLEKEFEELGYTSEQHDADVKKYRIIVEEPTTLSKEEIFGSKENPLKVNFSVPTIYEAKDLNYELTEESGGMFNRLRVRELGTQEGFNENISVEEYPGIAYFANSGIGSILVHDPKKVFGYEWFWIGGRQWIANPNWVGEGYLEYAIENEIAWFSEREQTVYNGMNENPEQFLDSLARGRMKIVFSEEFWENDYYFGDSTCLLLEEKTTGLFYKVPLDYTYAPAAIYLDIPASEYFVYVESKTGGEAQDETLYIDTMRGISMGYEEPFIGLLNSGVYNISSPKVEIRKETECLVEIGVRGHLNTSIKERLDKFRAAANENSEFLLYDFIHADKLLEDQSSYALYKLAKAYDKDVPEGYYKQYLTQFEQLHADAILPIDVKADAQDLFEARGFNTLYHDEYESEGYATVFVTGSVYTNIDKSKQMFYICGNALADIGPAVSRGNKVIKFAYPMDMKTRICEEMISAYDNSEMFGYRKGDLDEREYALQILRCCSDLYQYETKRNSIDCGIQMRFRSHTVKDPSKISGERMVYDRTVCQYLPESVIKYIPYAANVGVLIERDHSTPANSSSLWWEPLKKEPLGEIHLTEKDNQTITWPEYKEPIVERKDGTEVEPSGSAAVEQETTANTTMESRDIPSTESDEDFTGASEDSSTLQNHNDTNAESKADTTLKSTELKTTEHDEKDLSSSNTGMVVIIIILSVFAVVAIIGTVVVIKAKKNGRSNGIK